MPLSAGEDFAGFTVVRLLGTGGMGEVYLAKHPRLNRQDALKVLLAQFSADDTYRRRFEREADLAASLFHPHIVGVHDRGEFDGRLWISMDYVDGIDVGTLRRSRYPTGMPRGEVVEILTAIGGALDFAHERGLLHRDVKPSNILLGRPEAGSRRIMLADFGIARSMNDTSHLTATNMALGTLSYAAPEQLAGTAIDGRADQYALAATTYHLLTGGVLFDDPSPAVVISRHLYAPPPPISAAHPDLADLDPVFAKALAKDPARRFATCRDFAAAVRNSAAQHTQTPTRPVASPRYPAPPPAVPIALARPDPAPPNPPSRRWSPAAAVAAGLGALVVAALLVGAAAWLVVRLGSREDAAPVHDAQPLPAMSTTHSSTPAPVSSPVAAPLTPPRRPLPPDADQQGFLTGKARCDVGDRAEFILRTEVSRAVVCSTAGSGLYYRGARLSDGAGIELRTVDRMPGGFVAINDVDPTRYELSSARLRIVHEGTVVSDEPAVEAWP